MKNLALLTLVTFGMSAAANAEWFTPSDNYTIAKLSATETGESAGIYVRARLTVGGSQTREFFTNGVRDHVFNFDSSSYYSRRFLPTQTGTYVFTGVTRDAGGTILETFPALTVTVVDPRPEPVITVNPPVFGTVANFNGRALLSGTLTRFGSQIDNPTLEVGTSVLYGTNAPLKDGRHQLSWGTDTSFWNMTLAPLAPDTVHHCRISYQTADGMKYSEDHQFRTPPNSPPPQMNQNHLLGSSNQVPLNLGTDVDGHPISIVSTSALQWGTLNGAVYTAAPNFPGSETFTIITSDGYDQTTSTVRIATSEWYRSSCFGNFESFLVTDSGRPVGPISITLRPNGTFTGKFTHFGASYSFRGNIATQPDDWPTGSLEIARYDNSPFQMNVYVNPDPFGGDAIGLVTSVSGDGNVDLYGEWAAASSSSPPAEEIGQTNMLIPAEAGGSPSERPQGTGFGIMKIARKGSARWTGRSGDNQPFSVGTKYTANRSINVYSRVAGSGRERIFGTLSANGTSALRWYKPERVSGPYSTGFISYLQPVASRFEPYGSAETIFDSATEVSPMLAFTVYDHLGAVVTSRNLQATAKFDSGTETTDRVKLKINRKNGLFTGEIGRGAMNPNSERVTGIILPNARLGSGVWRKSGSDAKVVLAPIPE